MGLNKVKRNCKKRINGWKAVEIYIMKGYNCSKTVMRQYLPERTVMVNMRNS